MAVRSDSTAHPADGAAAVAARDLVLARGGSVVLARSSFALAPGTVTALIGPNGSGKSSLLDAIAGLLPVHAGALEVLGGPARPTRAGVAYVLQATSVNEVLPLSARDVVALARYPRRGLFGRMDAGDRAAVEEALQRLGVADLADRHLHDLSGGQRQRILVAQGLAQEADLLLLDEPLSGVDLVSRDQILDTVAEERRCGRTVVIATHDLTEAEHADQVLLLDGRVVAAGAPSAVITSEHLADAYGGRVLLLDGHAVLDDPHHPSPQAQVRAPAQRVRDLRR